MCPSFCKRLHHPAEEIRRAPGVMVRLASFSSAAVVSASLPHAGSRRARQPNKPLGDPDSAEEMILPQDTV